MSRQRRTWKKASPPPASYGWDADHPAHKEDPEMDDYFVGNNDPHEDFAEEPHSGPYPQGAAPASYGWEPDHPAAKADAGGKQASRQLRAMAERKAAKCVRLAQSMLGKTASVEEIENQALTLMDLSDRQITASLTRVRRASYYGQEEMMGHDLFEEYDHNQDGLIDRSEFGGSDAVFDALDSDMSGDLDESEIAMGLGESFARYASEEDRMLAEMIREERYARKQADHAGRSQNDPQVGYGIQEMSDEEATSKFPANLEKKKAFLTAQLAEIEELEMLAQMKEEAKMSMMGEDPVGIMAEKEEINAEEEEIAQLLAEMEQEGSEEMMAQEEMMAEEHHSQEMMAEEDHQAEDMVLGQDPMGLMGEDELMADDELMANLFGGKFAKEEEEEKAEEKEEEKAEEKEDGEEEEEKAEKKASRLRPQPRKASKGVKTLGATPKVASNEMSELQNLWTSAPDVSNVFGK